VSSGVDKPNKTNPLSSGDVMSVTSFNPEHI